MSKKDNNENKTTYTKNHHESKKYMGFPSKVWAIILVSFFVVLFIVFLVCPTLFGFVLSYKNGDAKNFFNHINYFTIFLSITATISSIISIFMSVIDRVRYNEEKKQSQEIMEIMRKIELKINNIK